MDHAEKELFGGAITSSLRTDIVDASDLRKVPDNQEVFLYPDSSISTIVEVLERVEPSEPEEAIRFHFDSLAHDNDATSSRVLEIRIVPNQPDKGSTPPAIILSGEQTVAKFNQQIPDQVHIFMALYRVAEKNVDLVVTLNIPLKTADGDAVGQEGLEHAKKDFDVLVSTFQIKDLGLFC